MSRNLICLFCTNCANIICLCRDQQFEMNVSNDLYVNQESKRVENDLRDYRKLWKRCDQFLQKSKTQFINQQITKIERMWCIIFQKKIQNYFSMFNNSWRFHLSINFWLRFVVLTFTCRKCDCELDFVFARCDFFSILNVWNR